MMPKQTSGFRAVLLALFVQLSWSAVALADEEPLAQVPGDAPIVIQIHGVQRTKERLLTMVKNALPELGARMQAKLEDNLKEHLKGRELQGLAPGGPDFVVVFSLPESTETKSPQIAYMARVLNFTDFRDGLLKPDERKKLTKTPAGYEVTTLDSGEKFYILERRGYTVFTSQNAVADQFTRTSPGLKLSKELAKGLLEPDLAVYVNVAAITAKYGEHIKSWRKLAEQWLGPESPWTKYQSKTNIRAMLTMTAAFFQATADARAAVAGVDFRPEGLGLHADVEIAADTPTDKFLKSFTLFSGDDLTTLPAGRMGYWIMKAGPQAVKASEWLATMMLGSDAERKTVQEEIDQLVAAKPRSFMGDFSLPPSSLKIWHFEDPAKAAAATLKLFQTWEAGETFQSAPIKGKPEIKSDARTYRGFHLNYVSFTWDLDKMLANYQGADEDKAKFKAAMEQVMGEGVKVWFGTNGKINVQVAAQDWPTAQRQLDRYLDGKDVLGQQMSYQETRKQLPTEATVLALVDAPRYVQKVLEPFMELYVKKASGRTTTGTATATEPGERPSFVGLAVQLQAEHAGFYAWLPGSAAHDIYKAYEPMAKQSSR